MNKWFVIMDFEAYYQHDDKIGRKNPDNNKKTENQEKSDFYNIKHEDIIVYYDYKKGLVIGLFQVESKSIEDPPKDELYWKNYKIFKIKPYGSKTLNGFIDFKKFLEQNEFISFDKSKLESLSRKLVIALKKKII